MTRFGKFPDSNIRTLAEEAVADALADAALTPGDVDIVFFSNATAGILTGQEMIRGQVALRHSGLLGLPIINVENACASASSAFYLAVNAVASGQAEVAIAVGSEKLTHEDKRKSFAAIGTAVDLFQLDDLKAWADGGSEGSPLPEEAEAPESTQNRSFFMDIYAANTRAYMERTGATREDFAQVAVKSHDHAALNPKAQYRTPVTVEEVLASREISGPLTLLMCSPIGDGAAAVIVVSPRKARELGLSKSARVAAIVLRSGWDHGGDEPGTVEVCAAEAYEQAGVGPEDLHVAEVHDASAPAEILAYESLGLCPAGEGGKLVESGATRLGGRIPVNTSGGLLRKGHPVGASGVAQIVELAEQLEGRSGARQVEGARVALAQNGGGNIGTDAAAMCVTILTR